MFSSVRFSCKMITTWWIGVAPGAGVVVGATVGVGLGFGLAVGVGVEVGAGDALGAIDGAEDGVAIPLVSVTSST
jgi:hypothetical protein